MRKTSGVWIVGIAATVAVVVVGASVTVGVAIASTPGPHGGIIGCVNNSTGALRVIDPSKGQHCTSSEQQIAWSSGSTGPQGIQEFTTSASWTAPAGVYKVQVELIGGGGAGGCGAARDPAANPQPMRGGGGGSGGFIKTVVNVTPGVSYTVHVATASAGGCPHGANQTGADGDATRLAAPDGTSLVAALGGSGGGASTSTTCSSTNTAPGGKGGTATPNTGIVRNGNDGYTFDCNNYGSSGGAANQGDIIRQQNSLPQTDFYDFGHGGLGFYDWPSYEPVGGNGGYAVLNW